MVDLAAHSRSPRAPAALLVALLHLLLAYGLLTGLGVDFMRSVESRLKVFAVAPDPPPPAAPAIPAPVRVPDPEGAAAPPSLKSRPSPVVAPRAGPRSPVRAAPRAEPLPTGSATKAGASSTPGEGTGAGGQGSGAGAGRGGAGTGGGGRPVRAQRIAGSFDYTDHPDRGRTDRAETVGVRFLVDAGGRVRDCTVTRSSGSRRVDATTCALIERRFRYRPATDAGGRPTLSVVNTVFTWIPDERRRRR
ncbi:MAG TPA: TonB family protein [Allosphingosinicella sp.]|jgi:protein TonB